MGITSLSMTAVDWLHQRDFSESAISMSLIGGMDAVSSVNHITGLHLRRAIVGLLLVARAPMSIEQIDRALRSHALSPSARSVGVAAVRREQHKAIAEVLRYQTSLGRVRRVQRGIYEAVPDGMSRSMRDRCVRSLRCVCEPLGVAGAWASDG